MRNNSFRLRLAWQGEQRSHLGIHRLRVFGVIDLSQFGQQTNILQRETRPQIKPSPSPMVTARVEQDALHCPFCLGNEGRGSGSGSGRGRAEQSHQSHQSQPTQNIQFVMEPDQELEP